MVHGDHETPSQSRVAVKGWWGGGHGQSLGIPTLRSPGSRSTAGHGSGDRFLESKYAMEATGLRVSRKHIEGLWTSVEDGTSDPHVGIFGPSSISWKVNRESALFLGAGRAALLQLAHPWVAAALHQHSNLRTDPLARFHNTFRVVFTMIFGTDPDPQHGGGDTRARCVVRVVENGLAPQRPRSGRPCCSRSRS